jgi:lipopolysaccharide transport system ATP-binding protein
MEPAIRVDQLAKRYRIGANTGVPYRTLRESIAATAADSWRNVLRFTGRRGTDGGSGSSDCADRDFWALKDVSFEIQPGEVVGIIGRNGAGKSTLLKILSRITEPTSGRAEFRGRIGSLLEVGTGFHSELTGRENIYLNGSILGMSRREIARRFDEIVAFSEIEDFLDTPVKRYSSGMYVRLAFAVAAHLEPEILVVDEVLAVGDHGFQKKCLGRMSEVGRSGRTVLFVSHDIAAVGALCGRCILLDRGQIIAEGEPQAVVARYADQRGDASAGVFDLTDHRGRQSGRTMVMTRVTLGDGKQSPLSRIRMGSSLSIQVDFNPDGHPFRPVLGVVIKTYVGVPLFGANNRYIPGYEFGKVHACGTVTCRLPDLPLMPGTYLLDLYLGSERRDLDVVLDAASFEVEPADVFGSGKLPPKAAGPLYWPATWELQAS